MKYRIDIAGLPPIWLTSEQFDALMNAANQHIQHGHMDGWTKVEGASITECGSGPTGHGHI